MSWSSRLSLRRLEEFERRGLISKDTATKLKDRIARKAVAGEPQAVRNRPRTYRGRQPPPPRWSLRVARRKGTV